MGIAAIAVACFACRLLRRDAQPRHRFRSGNGREITAGKKGCTTDDRKRRAVSRKRTTHESTFHQPGIPASCRQLCLMPKYSHCLLRLFPHREKGQSQFSRRSFLRAGGAPFGASQSAPAPPEKLPFAANRGLHGIPRRLGGRSFQFVLAVCVFCASGLLEGRRSNFRALCLLAMRPHVVSFHICLSNPHTTLTTRPLKLSKAQLMTRAAEDSSIAPYKHTHGQPPLS